jgi:uncharacterized membrane protein YqaE (UPF0057 family)
MLKTTAAQGHPPPTVATGSRGHTLGRVNKVILILLAIFLPPLAVYLKTKSGKDTLISLILSLVFWFPGVLFALWKVLA